MSESKLGILLIELEKELPPVAGQIVFKQYGAGPDESLISGDKSALMKYGLELIKSAVNVECSSMNGYSLHNTQLLVHPDSEFRFDYFDQASLPVSKLVPVYNSKLAKLIAVSFAILAFTVLALAVYGLTKLVS